MTIRLLFFVRNNLAKFSVLFLLFLSSNSYTQCAGTDTSVTICDVQHPSNQSINLFSLLGGGPTADGTWYDNSKPVGENVFNGIVNAQQLLNSGIYTYTYVQPSTSCTNNQATVTLKIGPYAGSPSPNISTCDDVESFNLFAAFDGTKLAPQQNGVWKNTSTGTVLSGNTINPKALGEGTYSYTYTIAAVDTCPAQSATVSITVFRKPKAGTPVPLVLCSTDAALNKNLNLNDWIVGEDSGGRWTDGSATGELTSAGDNRIDIENIYNSRGAGIYNFTYTVLSSSPICTDSRATVSIVIVEPLDFTGATLTVNSDICENQMTTATYSATLTRGPKAIPNGTYDVDYSINNGTTTRNITVRGTFTNGTFTFNVDRANLPAVGNYTFRITNISTIVNLGVCTNIIGTITDVLTIFPLPGINNGTLKIDPVCSGYNATVEISGNTNLANGNYRIVYSLSGDNVASNQPATFTAVNGVATFSIPGNLVTNAGTNTTFSIDNISNLTTGCFNTTTLSKVFTVNVSPDVSGITVSIANECLEGDTVVEMDGLGDLEEITIDYSLTGVNSASNETASVTVKDGKASYIIPATSLANTGTTTFTLNSLTVNSSSCGEAVVDNNTTSFTLDNCNVFIPDGFSPNGDTVNDTFKIPQIEFLYPNFSLEIYNRYGNLLFKGNKNKTEWNGRNSDYKIGIDGVAPNGVYFYILHFNKGNKKPIQGTLYLNR